MKIAILREAKQCVGQFGRTQGLKVKGERCGNRTKMTYDGAPYCHAHKPKGIPK